MSRNESVVVHEEDVEFESWDPALAPIVQWRTLLGSPERGTGEMSMGVAELGAVGAQETAVHRHAQSEIYYVLSGEGVVVIDGQEHPVRRGSTLYIPGNAWHGSRNTGPEVLRILYVFPVGSFAEVEYEFPAT